MHYNKLLPESYELSLGPRPISSENIIKNLFFKFLDPSRGANPGTLDPDREPDRHSVLGFTKVFPAYSWVLSLWLAGWLAVGKSCLSSHGRGNVMGR